MSDTTQDVGQWDPNEDDTIIIPLEYDYALVVGPNTKGFEKIDSSLVANRALNDLIASIGEGASLTGGAASATNAIQHMSGLYKLDAVTKAHLAAGNALTKTADGRLIGVVRNTGGQITRQAGLIPVSAPQIAGALAAIGPAVAMVAVQMQLNNISKQVSAVQKTALQTLQVLTDSRNADYLGDCQTINEIYQASASHGCVSDTDWSIISGLVSRIQSHRHFYKKQVANHQEALEKAHADSHTQRDYIQTNRDHIVNDSCAAFKTLRAWAHLTELRIARAQAQGEHPHAEPLQIHQEIIEDLQVQRALLHGLMRELRIIAELPGGWTVPASGKRKQAHLSQHMAQEIIGTLNPLVQQLDIQENPIPSPDVTCAPDGYDVSPYTKILRWYLNEGEELRGLAFPVNTLTHKIVAPTIDKIRSKPSVDSAWSNLPKPEDTTKWSTGRAKRAALRKGVSPEMVAVTDHRIITAKPQEFIQKGIVTARFAIDELTPVFVDADDTPAELHITQGEKKCREWRFPSAVRSEARSIAEMLVDDPAQLLLPTKPELADTQRDDIEASEKGDPKSAQNPESAKNEESADPGPEEAPTQPTA